MKKRRNSSTTRLLPTAEEIVKIFEKYLRDPSTVTTNEQLSVKRVAEEKEDRNLLYQVRNLIETHLWRKLRSFLETRGWRVPLCAIPL
jgi:hypothetical protein